MRSDRVRRSHVVGRLALSLTIVVGLGHAVGAAELAIPPRLVPRDLPRGFSLQTGPPNYSRWTDECVNCVRGANGETPLCSNVGIACQPKAIRCLDVP